MQPEPAPKPDTLTETAKAYGQMAYFAALLLAPVALMYLAYRVNKKRR